jgi:ABC-type Co2+ transport system permease subunit
MKNLRDETRVRTSGAYGCRFLAASLGGFTTYIVASTVVGAAVVAKFATNLQSIAFLLTFFLMAAPRNSRGKIAD